MTNKPEVLINHDEIEYIQPECPELELISKLAQKRKKQIKTALDTKCDKIMDQLGLDFDKNLTKKDVSMILDILNIELNSYQKAELYSTIERSHRFNSRSLKLWILKNRNFILCKVVNKYGSDKQIVNGFTTNDVTEKEDISLPPISPNKLPKSKPVACKSKLVMKPKKQSVSVCERNNRLKEHELEKRTIERLNSSIKKQKAAFSQNLKLLKSIRRNLHEEKEIKNINNPSIN